MQNEATDYGTVKATQLGPGTVGIRVPSEWCAHHGLSEGDTVYCTGHLSGPIEYHPEERPWAQGVRLQVRGNSPIVAIPAAIARPRGIGSRSVIALSVTTGGALFVEREDV